MKKIILILTLAVACMYTYTCNKGNLSIQSTSAVFGMENLPFSEFTIDPNSDTILTGKSGTKLKIDKKTFLDSKGNLVHGPVNIELKEAITKADIVLGNMTTLANGQILESGGMIYVNAKSGDENLSIASNKSIEVGVPTHVKKESMQIYSAEFDKTNQLNWMNPVDLLVKIEKPKEPEFMQDSTSRSPVVCMNEIKNQVSDSFVEPIKPKESSGRDTVLSLEFDTAEFSEMAEYRNVKFKVIDTKNFKSEDSKRIWMSMDLKKSKEEGIYFISFLGIQDNIEIKKTYKVTPIFNSGSDYKSAMAIYDKKFKEYENKKTELERQRIEDEKKQEQQRIEDQKKFEQDMKEAVEKAQKEFEENQKTIFQSGTNAHVTDPNLNYVFNLKKLGWANIDRLYSSPNFKPVNISVTIDNKDEFDGIYISLIMEKENVFIPGYERKDKTYGFSHGDFEKESLPIGNKATIIATTSKNNVTYYDMKKITISDTQNITLKLSETTLDKLKQEVQSKI